MGDFNSSSVDLDTADPAQIICYLTADGNDYNGQLGARISALFVILIVSSAATFFPIVARRIPHVRIPLAIYLFARYFGAGVIVATAFIHLLDPAYGEIGPNTCVGMTGNWAVYSWPPAIVLVMVMLIFLLDLASSLYVERKYGERPGGHDTHEAGGDEVVAAITRPTTTNHTSAAGPTHDTSIQSQRPKHEEDGNADDDASLSDTDSLALEKSFRSQIAAFLILEFGVIFHSVIIGLNLGVAGAEFATLYPVLVFHQSFEGLGIGARMSAIPFPKRSLLPWLLAAAYGLTTPLAIAIGLGLRTTYDPGSFTANVVAGVLDSMSAGILIWTGLVELLARDFLFDRQRERDPKRIAFMLACTFLGAGLMALLGKWA